MSDRDLIARLAHALRVQLDGVNLYTDLLAEADARALLAEAQPEPVCVACEGRPAPGNSPCGLCGLPAKPQPEPVERLERQGNSSAILTSSQAKPVEPTDEQLLSLRSWSSHGHTFDSDLVAFARAVLARWGRPAPEPVSVAERWPEFSDCDQLEKLWVWNPVLDHWKLNKGIKRHVHTHWLPHWALPVPQEQADG